ncbi:unnamed protein product [Spirodela intermedia]|uniref:Uncharacterized protein n=1 Tax=Spirodela intermedia TaxID=51605 RepID=A0A7I8IFN6_SPIIN|nr:unnamed protein product [Spirodela intermedia]CAA6656104.1 unnamed protein product [Spirodela intermedia]
MTLLEEEQEACNYAMQLASASVLPMTLKAAIELNLLEIISRGVTGAQLFPEEIVAQLPIENPDVAVMVDRILRLLASYSILTCSVVDGDGGKVRRRYGLAPVARFLTQNEDGVSMATLALMNQDKILMESWYYLKESAYGMTAFEYHGTDPRFNTVFNAGMSNHSTITMKKMLEIYRGFDGLGVLVDVGGHVGGDMFESVPSGDAIFMKRRALPKGLKNCWKALPEQGKIIVMEGILPEAPETTREAQSLFQLDMIMLAHNPGGKERTEKDFQSLAKSAGFSGFAKVSTAFGVWIMEFTK